MTIFIFKNYNERIQKYIKMKESCDADALIITS